MSNDDMIEGYFDGKKSEFEELPNGSNRSDSYKHGWRNGRDDRMGRPRESAESLRHEAAEIAARESHVI